VTVSARGAAVLGTEVVVSLVARVRHTADGLVSQARSRYAASDSMQKASRQAGQAAEQVSSRLIHLSGRAAASPAAGRLKDFSGKAASSPAAGRVRDLSGKAAAHPVAGKLRDLGGKAAAHPVAGKLREFGGKVAAAMKDAQADRNQQQ